MTPQLFRRPKARLESLEERINLSPPTVVGLQIDDGNVQRSMVRSLTITFSEPVSVVGLLTDAIHVNRNTASLEQPGVTGLVNLSAVMSGSGVTVTFNSSGPNPVFGVGGAGNLSLPNGRYSLFIDASRISSGNGQLDGNGNGVGGDNYVLTCSPSPAAPNNIFRRFGDVTGDGGVTSSDFNGTAPTGTPPNVLGFLQSFGGVNPYFDYNGNGSVDAFDFLKFKQSAAAGFP